MYDQTPVPSDPTLVEAAPENPVDPDSARAVRFGLFGLIGMPGSGLLLRAIASMFGEGAGSPTSYFFFGVAAWAGVFAYLGLVAVTKANEVLRDPEHAVPRSSGPFWAGFVLGLANLLLAVVLLIVLASTRCLVPTECGL